jgi:hypothetical protein
MTHVYAAGRRGGASHGEWGKAPRAWCARRGGKHNAAAAPRRDSSVRALRCVGAWGRGGGLKTQWAAPGRARRSTGGRAAPAAGAGGVACFQMLAGGVSSLRSRLAWVVPGLAGDYSSAAQTVLWMGEKHSRGRAASRGWPRGPQGPPPRAALPRAGVGEI